MYAERYGQEPVDPPQLLAETLDVIRGRFNRIRDVQESIALRLREHKPDAVILIGNDQDENYGDWAAPQFAIYTGAQATVSDWLSGSERTYDCAQGIAVSLLRGCVQRGFDVVQTKQFKGDKLSAHAHAQVYRRFIPDADIPIIPVFVNAITPPYASPGRCFEFGRALRAALAESEPNSRVIIGTSGGLSHFTASYPYAELSVPRPMGGICTDFDDRLIAWLRAGELERVAELTNQDLLDNGDVEFRQGIAFLGALTERSRPQHLEYQPFYRGLMGFWAGYWEQHD